MPEFRLRFAASDKVSAKEAATSFYWLPDGKSTIIALRAPGATRLGPNLGALGEVPDLNIDLVRIAVTVYAADRSVKRSGGGSNWNRRSIQLTVPVLDRPSWRGAEAELTQVVNFLTGDDWSFKFVSERAPSESVTMPTINPVRVVLLSGGADSAIGALVSRSQLADDQAHTLVSHFSSTLLSPLQRDIASRIEALTPGPAQEHVQVHLGRGGKRIDGEAYTGDEQTTRSRSLLFLALGLAVASTHQVPVWIPENGFASLNPPLGRERLGSISTRTTHPTFLADLSALLAKIGAHGDIVNPFARLTKGEMFSRTADLIGKKKAAELLGATNSCAHTGQRTFKISTGTPCGVCFGCIVRRASFVAAGIKDNTEYISAGGRKDLEAWLAEKSIERAVQRFTKKGVTGRDLIAMSLPEDYPLSEASELCARGIGELSGLFK